MQISQEIQEKLAYAALSAMVCKTETPTRDLGRQIVVMDRGFVYVGNVTLNGEFVTISNAKNIRVWGTTRGLGELVAGPTASTKLDDVGDLLAPMKSVIHFVKCNW